MFGYFGSKLASERAVVESGLPWTTLCASDQRVRAGVERAGAARLFGGRFLCSGLQPG